MDDNEDDADEEEEDEEDELPVDEEAAEGSDAVSGPKDDGEMDELAAALGAVSV